VLTIFIAAFGLGLVFNAAPGPLFAETVRRGVRGGFSPALAVQIGSLAGDAVWAVLGLTGIGLLFQSETLRAPVGIAGAAYLLWLAWDAWRASTQDFAEERTDNQRAHTALRSGILLSLTNPQNIGYWAAVGSALGSLGVDEPQPAHYVTFFSGFMLSSIVWAFFFAAAVNWLFGRVGTRWARITYRLCAVTLLALACASLNDVLRSTRSQNQPVIQRE
jgi:chemosensory pili system protein ChpE